MDCAGLHALAGQVMLCGRALPAGVGGGRVAAVWAESFILAFVNVWFEQQAVRTVALVSFFVFSALVAYRHGWHSPDHLA